MTRIKEQINEYVGNTFETAIAKISKVVFDDIKGRGGTTICFHNRPSLIETSLERFPNGSLMPCIHVLHAEKAIKYFQEQGLEVSVERWLCGIPKLINVTLI